MRREGKSKEKVGETERKSMTEKPKNWFEVKEGNSVVVLSQWEVANGFYGSGFAFWSLLC